MELWILLLSTLCLIVTGSAEDTEVNYFEKDGSIYPKTYSELQTCAIPSDKMFIRADNEGKPAASTFDRFCYYLADQQPLALYMCTYYKNIVENYFKEYCVSDGPEKKPLDGTAQYQSFVGNPETVCNYLYQNMRTTAGVQVFSSTSDCQKICQESEEFCGNFGFVLDIVANKTNEVPAPAEVAETGDTEGAEDQIETGDEHAVEGNDGTDDSTEHNNIPQDIPPEVDDDTPEANREDIPDDVPPVSDDDESESDRDDVPPFGITSTNDNEESKSDDDVSSVVEDKDDGNSIEGFQDINQNNEDVDSSLDVSSEGEESSESEDFFKNSKPFEGGEEVLQIPAVLEDTAHQGDKATQGEVDRNILLERERAFLEQESSSHFLAYSLTAIILIMVTYILYHNKQKIVAIIIEGRHGGQGKRRRFNQNVYTTLDETT